MLNWLMANAATLMISCGLLLALCLAARSMRRNRMRGGCPGGCAGCGQHASCLTSEEKETVKR